MRTRGPDQKRVEIISRFCNGKEFAKLSRYEKTTVVTKAFKEIGRAVKESWSYENVKNHIPFVYTSHPEEEAWNGITSYQSLEKFKRGQEEQKCAKNAVM